MKASRPHLLFVVHAATLVILSLAVSSQAQTEVILHNFARERDGGQPYAPLTFDAAGNIYGTATEGGDTTACNGVGCGVVFKLSPTGTGGWGETVLRAFPGGYMGSSPDSGVLFDSAGNLYGVTSYGGYTKNMCPSNGCGVVYELSPTGAGGYKEKVLHAFSGGTDGYSPSGGLVFDAQGNLYGTTPAGGTGSEGTVYELSPNGSGGWTESILVNFSGSNGANPSCTLLIDAQGNLYGTAAYGGANVNGIVFELSPGSGGTWTETILYNFGTAPDLTLPFGGLTADAEGNLYGSAEEGGPGKYYGGVFQLVRSASVPWPENILYTFDGDDGENPFTNVTLDGSGNVFVSTPFGGSHSDGTISEVSPSGSGWSALTLWNFDLTDGQTPNALTLDASGNIYGVTTHGGTKGEGTVFEIKP
jgi:uncharacterized repeat protein (TIGR03803 family)